MYAQFAGTDWKRIWLTSALCAWVFFVGHAVGLSAAPGDTPALKSGSNSSFQGGSAKAMARDKKLVEDTTASASDSERRVTRWSNEDKQAQMIGKETKKNLIKNASPVKTRQKANCTKNVFLKPIIAKKEQQAPYMYAALKHKKHKSHKSLHEAPCTSLPQNQKSFFPIWFTWARWRLLWTVNVWPKSPRWRSGIWLFSRETKVCSLAFKIQALHWVYVIC